MPLAPVSASMWCDRVSLSPSLSLSLSHLHSTAINILLHQSQKLMGCVCHSYTDSSTEPNPGQVIPLAGNATRWNLQLWLVCVPISFLYPSPWIVTAVFSCDLPPWDPSGALTQDWGFAGN